MPAFAGTESGLQTDYFSFLHTVKHLLIDYCLLLYYETERYSQ